MRARKYVAFGIAVVSSVALAIGAAWVLYSGRDPKMSGTGSYVALPFGLSIGGGVSVGICILLNSLRPAYRLPCSLLFAALVALVVLAGWTAWF